MNRKFLSYAILNEERIFNKDETFDAYRFFYDWNEKFIGFGDNYAEDYNGPEEVIYGADFF